jgi:hypothetical protein
MKWRFAEGPDEEAWVRSHIEEEWGGGIIDPQVRFLVLVDSDNVLRGFTTLQRIVHWGPTWVAPDSRSPHTIELLSDAMKGALGEDEGLLTFTTDPRVSRLMQFHGLQLIEDAQLLRWRRQDG